jgi:DNA-binding PadR family transcriptional regulator
LVISLLDITVGGINLAREQFQTLSEPMYYILLALIEECCGVDIMGKVKKISNNRVIVGPGTLYALLPKFEKSGFIKQTVSDGRKKSYIITQNGIDILKAEYKRLKDMSEDGKQIMEEM